MAEPGLQDWSEAHPSPGERDNAFSGATCASPESVARLREGASCHGSGKRSPVRSHRPQSLQ